ncbi:hypothetical protein TWF730_001603 [Orbilia blumenaviensis]|uniref:Uncharacterized protein n=1 Tax=Orbilia blumenaviensis TaxID=1796055 RepID=A0AAV9UI58_9PEZI
MTRKRLYTQADYEAFHEESKTFIPSRASSTYIREILGIPERVIAGGLKSIDNNIEWNEIRDGIRKILKNRNLDDLDEQLDIANQIQNLEPLCRHTAEPRKFFEWFRYNHGRNVQKVEKRRKISRTDPGEDVDESECEKTGFDDIIPPQQGESSNPESIMSLRNISNPTQET